MSGICKLNMSNWTKQRSELCMFSHCEDELLSDVKRPSLSSISITDSSHSDLSLDRNNILVDISMMNEQSPLEFSLNDTQLKVQESKVNTLSKTNHNSLTGANTACDQLSKLHNMDSKSLCVNNNFIKAHKRKSVSLHDISSFPSSLLNAKTDNGISSETLHSNSLSSTVKSKDSGIHRSISCLSLTSGNRSYDHVQSKVKEYIQNIKETEAQRKKNRFCCTPIETPLPTSVVNSSEEPEKLKKKICELESELKEKSILLDTQQEQYNALLYKYAEAKNIIDSIRFEKMRISYNSTVKDKPRNSTFPNSSNSFHISSIRMPNKYLSRSTINNKEGNKSLKVDTLCDNLESDSFAPLFPNCSTPLCSPNHIKNLLGPVSSIFSSSARLDKQFVPLTKCETFRNCNETGFRLWQTISNDQESCLKPSNKSSRVDNSCRQSSTFSNLHKLKRQAIQSIDLPKDAPFDKVRKWQESLPSIDLLGTCSTSNSDGTDTSLKERSDLDALNPKEVLFNMNSGQCTRTNIQEKLINIQNTKSHLQKKCVQKSIEQGFDNRLNAVKYSNSAVTLSINKNLKQLVSSEDSSSVSSSVLDSMSDLYSFVQKKSPKRKINSLNYYSPCKNAELKETSHPSCGVENSGSKQEDLPKRILRESRLNHLFTTDSTKVGLTQKFQSVDKTDDNIWWKNTTHTQFKKSKNLQECLKHAEYFVTILSDGLKGIESTLDKTAKIV